MARYCPRAPIIAVMCNSQTACQAHLYRGIFPVLCKDAVLNASKRRMRPIFLTSAAATMGVLPMVIGNSALWQPMGVVIFYGTPITMIFILTVIPVAYWKMKAKSKNADKPLEEPLETHLV